jgi:hypothetical protein
MVLASANTTGACLTDPKLSSADTNARGALTNPFDWDAPTFTMPHLADLPKYRKVFKDPEEVLRMLRSPSAAERSAGFLELDLLGAGGKVLINDLTRMLKDPDPDTRMRAAKAIGDLGNEGARGIPSLLTGLSDPHPWVIEQCISSLSRIGRGTEKIRAAIGRIYRSEKAPLHLRVEAAYYFWEVRKDKEALGFVTDALDSQDEDGAYQSLHKLQFIAHTHPEIAIPVWVLHAQNNKNLRLTCLCMLYGTLISSTDREVIIITPFVPALRNLLLDLDNSSMENAEIRSTLLEIFDYLGRKH